MTKGEFRMTNDEFSGESPAIRRSSFVIRNSAFVSPSFSAYSPQHLITLGLLAFLCFFIAWFGRKGQDSRRVWLGRMFGLVLLAYVIVFYTQQGLLHALSWEYSLPLDLCNLSLAACIISLFWKNKLAAEIAYFWGLGGGLQALATPDLGLGFPSWDFFLFFWGHGATLLAIVFLIACRNFRPRRGSVARMMIALNLYALAVGAINAIGGWNYGYLCRKPYMPSLLDFLGPWPWYLLSLEIIALASFFILDIPWRLPALFRRRRREIPEGGVPEALEKRYGEKP
jgi:hypothetical integral membrane protein (TIGR02206 family)